MIADGRVSCRNRYARAGQGPPVSAGHRAREGATFRPIFNSHAHGAQRLQRILPLMGSDPIVSRSGWPLLD